MIHEDSAKMHTPKQTVERKIIFKSPKKKRSLNKKIHHVNEVDEKKYETVSLKLKGISELTKMSVSHLKNFIVQLFVDVCNLSTCILSGKFFSHGFLC